MKPLTVLTGIVLGTCVSISVSLAAVLLMFLVLGDDYPRLSYEQSALLASLGIFTGMTAISAGSFYSLLVGHSSRWALQAGMWAGVIATSLYYWPD
ncbi:MAG: hypothetical protein R3315_01020 [Woeseiaceae bacterium]|nr:hypothetical protein [Woeseiaceae bacterium]